MLDVVERLIKTDNRESIDYEQDGILMCGKCHTPKQKRQEFQMEGSGTFVRVVPITCQCTTANLTQEKAEREREQFRFCMEKYQEMFSISDRTYRGLSFDKDDQKNRKVSEVCRAYVDRWEEMRLNSMGVLFYGGVGTGKSFYACCIVNALLEKCIPATVTNFPRLLNLLQSCKDRQEAIDHLQDYQLLVIDDLGVERDSSYAAEQVFNVIDARARSGLPLIVTTNLTMTELKSSSSMQYARIYDRVMEMCPIPIKMAGESRRLGNAEVRMKKAMELLSPKHA